MRKNITLLDVKQALLDPRFRESLPDSLQPEVTKFLQNPGCACNHPIYRKIMQQAPEHLAKYYPTKEMVAPEKLEEKIAKNNWMVINCSVAELAEKLSKSLPRGRVQLEIARWQDQVTVVINELEGIY